MEKKHIIASIGLVAIVSFFIIAANAAFVSDTPSITGNVVQKAVATGKQVDVKMTMSGGTYIFDPASVNVGDSVRIIADTSKIRGCYSTVVIPDLGVRESVTASDNTIEFVASKAGTFQVTCGMGMADGQFVVKDAAGNAPASTTTIKASGGSCGSGGCGCGG